MEHAVQLSRAMQIQSVPTDTKLMVHITSHQIK